MPTPSHGFDCVSKTYPTDCNHCGKTIYVYQCSHESVVLFDSLGGGWRQHICSYWREAAPTFAGDIPAIVHMHNREITRVRRQLNDELGLQRNSLVGATVEARNSGELAEWFVTEIVAMEV